MPRSGTGIFALADTLSPATLADANEVMAIFDDIASALTGSVASDGQTPQTGQLRGLVSANPGYSFNGDLNTGFGSDVPDEVYLQANGVKTFRATATGTNTTGKALENGFALVPTGVAFDYVGLTAPGGYVLGSGESIGNALSGASARANADTQALFELIWNSANIANGEGQVRDSAGNNVARGANATNDFNANRRIVLADYRGRVSAGRDIIVGGALANRLTVAGCGIDGTVQGNTGGLQTHTLTTAELASHTHINTLTDPTHTHTQAGPTGGGGFSQAGGFGANGQLTTASPTGIVINNVAAGGGGAHNNVPPAIIKTKIIKL